MKKIAIIGSGGAGKSTLARELGQILNLPVYHIDSLNWKPGWISIPANELDRIMEEVVRKDEWIIDGNYDRTMDSRLNESDMVIYLDYPTYLCLIRAIKRRIMYHGRTRPDMGEGCNERMDMEFIKWILNFRRDKRPDLLKKLNKLGDKKQIHILKSPRQLKKFINNLNFS